MRPLSLEEIVPRDRYAALRPGYRDAIIAHKRNRRMAVGERVTLLFEDRETLRFQVQEMVWVEGIGEPEKIQREIDVYNELMPGDRELSATLFIEITDLAEIRPELERLVGLDEHVALSLGTGRDAEAIPARFDTKQFEQDRISAVQYIRFGLSDSQAHRFADLGVRAAIRIDHPQYRHEIEIPAPVRASLVSTLSCDPEPLVPAAATPARSPGPTGASRPKRERYFVDPLLQLAVLVPLLTVMGIVAIAYVTSITLLLGDPARKALTVDETRTLFLRANGVYFIIAVVGVGAVAIFLTHRVAGPAGVIERAVRGLKNGEYSQRLSLRPHDYLKPVALAVTDLRNHLRAQDEHRRQLLEALATCLNAGDLTEARNLIARLGLPAGDTAVPSRDSTDA